MISLAARARQRIEAALGRSLTTDEAAAAELAALPPPILAVARALAAIDLAICLQYLLAVTSASARDVLLFTHRW
jgi:hypothetical protein